MPPERTILVVPTPSSSESPEASDDVLELLKPGRRSGRPEVGHSGFDQPRDLTGIVGERSGHLEDARSLSRVLERFSKSGDARCRIGSVLGPGDPAGSEPNDATDDAGVR